jgi:calmodulin, striated muscle
MIKYSQKAHLKEGSKEDELEKDLRAAFNVFDHDNNGHINREELRSALRMIGEKLTDKEIDKILSSIDCDKDGQISYQQFVKIFL